MRCGATRMPRKRTPRRRTFLAHRPTAPNQSASRRRRRKSSRRSGPRGCPRSDGRRHRRRCGRPGRRRTLYRSADVRRSHPRRLREEGSTAGGWPGPSGRCSEHRQPRDEPSIGHIQSLAGVQCLPSLVSLTIPDAQAGITDLSPLSSMVDMERLILWHCGAPVDVRQIAGLTQLRVWSSSPGVAFAMFRRSTG